MHGGGHGARVQGVADAEGGFEGAVSDARFGFFGDEVEDGGAGCFAAGAGGGGNSDEGRERFGYWEAAAAGRISHQHAVVEVGGRVQIGIQAHGWGRPGLNTAAGRCAEEFRVNWKHLQGRIDKVEELVVRKVGIKVPGQAQYQQFFPLQILAK